MANNKSPFSSLLKTLGDSKLIQELGEAALKALDSATKAIENATASLDAIKEKNSPTDKTIENNTARPNHNSTQKSEAHPGNETHDAICSKQISTPKTIAHRDNEPHNTIRSKQNSSPKTKDPNYSLDAQSIRRLNIKQLGIKYSSEIHTEAPQDAPCHVIPSNADNFRWIDTVLNNGIHIREFLWHEPEIYESAYASREGRPDSGGNMLVIYITGYEEDDNPQNSVAFELNKCQFYNIEFDSSSIVISKRAFSKGIHLKTIQFNSPIDIVEKQAFAVLPELKTVQFMHVSRIEDGAFQNCPSLENVKLKGVTFLGNRCFYHCQKLNNVSIPNSCTAIGQECFSKCWNLGLIHLPQSLKTLEEKTFYNSRIKAIKLPLELESIGDSCFQDCNHLTDIEIPSKCRIIGKYCFMSCGQLKHIHLPGKLQVISDKAFANCSSLESIDWPKYQYINGELFPKIGNNILTGIYIYNNSSSYSQDGEADTIFKVVDGVMTRVPRTPEYHGIDYILPSIPAEISSKLDTAKNESCISPTNEQITSPDSSENSDSLKKNILNDDNPNPPESKTLSDIAKPAVKALSSVFQSIKNNVIPQSQPLMNSDKGPSVTPQKFGFLITKGKYGDKIIGYKGSQKKIVIPDGIKDIGDFAFQNNKSIEAVMIPNSVWNIGRSAFKNCTSLKFVSLPNNDYFITTPTDMFKGCTSLTSIVWNPNLKLIRRDSIEDCPLSQNTLLFLQNKYVYSNKRAAYIPYKIAQADEISGSPIDQSSAPFPTISLRVSHPDDSQPVKREMSAEIEFSRPNEHNEPPKIERKKVEFPKTIEMDDLYVCQDVLVGIKEGLTELVIPEYIHEIEANAFNLGTELKSIVFKGTIRQICENAFCGLRQLQTVIFEDDVQEIERCAFKRCYALENVIFKKGLTDLWNSCFEGCISLKEIILPDSCEIIGEDCFSYCILLKHVHLPANLKALQTGAFNACYALETLDWPTIRVIDKHTYPKISPDVFINVLNDDNWERFELHDGTFKRILVPALSEDPDGLFDLMLPGEANIYRRLPQLVMNATLNHLWEHSSNSEQYTHLLSVLKACLSFAQVFTCALEDDRAMRLCILDDLRVLLLRSDPPTQKDLLKLIPYAIYDTLFAICGKGSIRKYYDKQILKLTCPFMNIDPKTLDKRDDSGSDDKSDKVLKFIDNIYDELKIGPHQPFRYDTWQTSLNVILNMNDADFYTFSHYMSVLAESIFHKFIRLDVELVDSNIDEWCLVWNNFLHDNYSPDFHVVMFKPYDFETEYTHNTNCRFVAILTWEQIYALRTVLTPYELESMMTVYTMELHSDVLQSTYDAE